MKKFLLKISAISGFSPNTAKKLLTPFFIAYKLIAAKAFAHPALDIRRPKIRFKTFSLKPLALQTALVICGLLIANTVFAKFKVTAVTAGNQTGTATYGTPVSPTYQISLTQQSTGGSIQATENLTISWAAGVPTGVTTSLNTPGTGGLYTPNGATTAPLQSFTLTINTTSATPVGTYTFTVTSTDFNGNNTPTTTTGILVVGKKALTGITANKVYDGTTAATLTGTLNGIVGSDNVSFNPNGTFASANASTGIVVTASLTGTAAGNYTLSGLTANITPAPLTITVGAKSKTYGTALTSASGITAFSSSGLISGQTIGSVTITYGTGGAAMAAVGTYTGQATPSAPTGGTFSAGNYSITYNAGNIIVTPATLTITADNISRAYGSSNALTATYSGFQGTDTYASVVTTAATLGSTASPTTNVGTYAITVSGAVLANSNYNIIYAAGTLTVTTAPLTVSADNQTKLTGTSNPTLTVSYSGFVNGDGPANLTTQPVLTTTAVKTSPAGIYPITFSTVAVASSNYTVTSVNGILTIVTAIYNWTGAQDANWVTPQNWTVNGVQQTTNYPGSSDANDAVQIGVSAPIINMPIISSTSNIASLTFGGSSVLSLGIGSGANLIIGSDLTLNPGAGVVNLSNSGSITIGGDYTSNSGSTLNLSGAGPVTFGGDFTNGGATTFGTGLVTFNSTTGTSSGPTLLRTAASSPVIFINLAFGDNGHFQFKSLTGTGNTAVFYLASTGIFKVGGGIKGTTINVANATFYLLSDASGSAAIDNIPSNSKITGTFYVQRFITGKNSNTYRGYRVLSSPVYTTSAGAINYVSLAYLNATVNGFHGAFTGGPGAGFSMVNGNPTVYLYNESLPVSNTSYVSGKHVGIYAITGNTVTTVSNATGPVITTPGVSIPAGNGYLLYFIGPNTRTNGAVSPAPADATLTASGSLNEGDVLVNLWHTPNGQLSYTSALSGPGFNMVGNPYACTIDLSKVISDNTAGIDNIFMLDPAGPSQYYTAFTAAGNSAPGLGYAISGAGFIVHAKGTGATLTFHESEKAASQVLSGVLMGKPVNEPALAGLYIKLEQDSIHHSYCGIYFRGDWSDKFEPGDAIDMNNSSSQLDVSSLSADGIHAAVNHMPGYTAASRIRLYTNAPASGAYTLKIEGIRNIDTLHDIWLVDRYKNDSLNIRRQGSYAFNIVKSDTASYGNNRFVLAIRLNPAYAYHLLDFTAQRIAHSPHVELDWKTKYEQNYINFTVERSTDGGKSFTVAGGLAGTGAGNYSLTDKNPLNGQNLYRLKQEDAAGAITYSQVVEVMMSGNGNSDMVHVYPNPAVNVINLNVTGKTTGNTSYDILVTNSSGLIVKQATSAQLNWQANVADLLPGTYLVKVLDRKDKSLLGQTKFVKL
jgi:hypothetical protein